MYNTHRGIIMSNLRYKVSNAPLEKMNIQLLYITQAKYDKDWLSIQHTHHFTELFYVIRGEGYFLVDEQKEKVKQDDFIIVNPNVSHTEVGEKNSTLEYIVLGIDGLQFLNDEQQGYYDFSIHNYEDYKHEILFYLRTLVEEAQRKDDHFENICHNLLEILIINMLRRTNKSLLIEATQKVTKECKFIEQYINEHYTEDITLQKLSELTYLNKYYIVHSFKKYKGLSPINYMIAKRIEEAQNLLTTTTMSLSKVAEALGFSSQSYFSQIFKKEVKVTPNQYRKNAEKEKKCA